MIASVSTEKTPPKPRPLTLKAGCEFHYYAECPTPSTVQVEVRAHSERHRTLNESWSISPDLPTRQFIDIYGNLNRRFIMPQGQTIIRYNATVEVDPEPDEVHAEAVQLPIEELPAEALHYLFPSRYCLSDLLFETAWDLFSKTAPGWTRVQAICDWIHGAITYDDKQSNTNTTALDVYNQRTGICRDFSHLGISFCRALNIPARYVFGYLPEINVPPSKTPMDFHAWFEVFLGGRWYTCDARHNIPRIGRVIVGYGRDAVDCSMLTTFGPATLKQITVWADEAA